MNYWMKTIINRLETAYQTRFDMKASLVFLNDAYQNSIEWFIYSSIGRSLSIKLSWRRSTNWKIKSIFRLRGPYRAHGKEIIQ